MALQEYRPRETKSSMKTFHWIIIRFAFVPATRLTQKPGTPKAYRFENRGLALFGPSSAASLDEYPAMPQPPHYEEQAQKSDSLIPVLGATPTRLATVKLAPDLLAAWAACVCRLYPGAKTRSKKQEI